MGTYRGGYVYRRSLALVEVNARIVAARPGAPARRRPDCGTQAAYKRHRKLREPPCEACKKAAREERARYARRLSDPASCDLLTDPAQAG